MTKTELEQIKGPFVGRRHYRQQINRRKQDAAEQQKVVLIIILTADGFQEMKP